MVIFRNIPLKVSEMPPLGIGMGSTLCSDVKDSQSTAAILLGISVAFKK